jgi:YVTN family beta-propeller protein
MGSRQRYVLCFVAIAALSLASDRTFAQTRSPPLQFEGKIALGDVRGRIDHMAIDLPRRRLFVAELGNDTVGVVDLTERKVLHVISGLKEPQGVGYVSSSDTLPVTVLCRYSEARITQQRDVSTWAMMPTTFALI